MITDAGGTDTPRLLDYTIDKQFEGNLCPGWYIVVILMENVPGQNLDGRFHEFPLEKRNRVRMAFAKALRYVSVLLPPCSSGVGIKPSTREFYRCKLSHLDPSLRNIVWDDESERWSVVHLSV